MLAFTSTNQYYSGELSQYNLEKKEKEEVGERRKER